MRYEETHYTSISISTVTTLSIVVPALGPRSEYPYADEDCTTSTTPPPASTTSAIAGAAGAATPPSCTVTKLTDAVIGLGVLCGFSIIGCIVLLILFIKQSNSSEDRSNNRNRDSTSPHSRPSSPLGPWHHLRDFDTRSGRGRAYDGLGIGGSRDGRLHRRHSMHDSPQARDPMARSPLAPPPRYMERAPGNMSQPHNRAMFPRSPGMRGMFARSPLMAGYPFLRNPNINPMAFPQAQAGHANMQMPQMPHPGHLNQQQSPMYQQHVHQHPEQPGAMHPEHVAMADMRAAQEQAQQRGSVRPEEGNVGRSRDPSNAGTAVRDDALGRLRREALGSRRASRSETEGSRGRRGGLFDGGPPGPL